MQKHADAIQMKCWYNIGTVYIPSDCHPQWLEVCCIRRRNYHSSMWWSQSGQQIQEPSKPCTNKHKPCNNVMCSHFADSHQFQKFLQLYNNIHVKVLMSTVYSFEHVLKLNFWLMTLHHTTNNWKEESICPLTSGVKWPCVSIPCYKIFQ